MSNYKLGECMSQSALEILAASMIVALVGWLATIYWLKGIKRLTDRSRGILIVATWFPWMVLALATVVMPGKLPLADALQGTTAFSVGMVVFLISSRRKTSRS